MQTDELRAELTGLANEVIPMLKERRRLAEAELSVAAE